MRGAQDTRQHLLCVGATSRPIAAATHFAGDDGGTKGLLRAPIGRVEARVDEKAEKRGQFDGQMTGEALNLFDRAWILEQVQHLVEEMPARDIDAVCRDRAGGATVTHFEGMLEDARDPRRKAGPWMIVLQRATSPQQMTETGLMERVGKLAIRRPAVAPEAAREVRADH